jgi:soluble lytic murein transglycosylase
MMPGMPRLIAISVCLGLLFGQLLAACSLPVPASTALPPSATPAPSDTPIPAPTPTATPAPAAFVDQADDARRNGDWETAEGLYRQARSAAGDSSDGADAQLGLATTLLQAGKIPEAVEEFNQLLASEPQPEQSAEAFFLRAVAYEQLGQAGEALQDYQQYLSLRPGVLDAFVQEKIGDLWRAAGAPLDAVAAYRAALVAPRLAGDGTLRVKIGRALVEADDLDGSLAEYDALAATSADPSLLATLNFLSGLVLEKKGETAAAQARYLDSVQRFPEAYDAYSGLVRLVDAGVPVDDYLRGYIDYQAGAYEPARLALDRAIASLPTAAAHYYRALASLEVGDVYGTIEDLRTVVLQYPESTQRADAWLTLARIRWTELDLYADSVDTYLDFVANLPGHAQAPAALFAAGRVAERSGDLGRAADIWLRIPAEYPSSGEAFAAAFQSGIARFRQPAYDQALAAFQIAETASQDSGERAAALLWLGKSRQALGDSTGAGDAWRAAEAADPTGYYSLRAADLLAGRAAFQSLGVFDFTTDADAERAEAEAWLRSTFTIAGPEPLSDLGLALAADPRWARGVEFLRLGMYGEAKAELESLRLSVETDAEATYRLMHAQLDLRMYPSAIFAARQILRLAGMDDAATQSAPVYFNHIRFAPYFGELILPAAAEAEFDPLFLLSVVRQESLFEGYATSYAEARGLMQVIPSTGAQLAVELGWPPGYTDKDLYRPIVSVRFGTAYLLEQRQRFDGDLVAALAAYNAGPGAALIWKELAPSDPDLFLEVIRLDQPHLYITTIYEVFCRYRALYAS